MIVPATGQLEITALLNRWSRGDREAGARVVDALYAHLRRIAAHHARDARNGSELHATALVHEAYLRLRANHPEGWQSRNQFLGFAARVMRQVLIDAHRRDQADKRGNGVPTVSIDHIEPIAAPESPWLHQLDSAIDGLRAISPRDARIVELRFLAGLSIDETAASLGVSRKTVVRGWRRARVWLFVQLRPDEP